MTADDISRVLAIYKMGLDTRMATFETVVPSWNDWNSKHLKHSRLVYSEIGKIFGWSALSSVSTRLVYKGVAEISIYVDTENLCKGIGSQLMHKLITSSEQNGIWTLYSSVFPENIGTLKLHDKFGFRIIGIREKIAQLDGKWKDTILLERRSKIIGV